VTKVCVCDNDVRVCVCFFSTLLFLVSELALALQMEFIWFSLSRSYPYGRSCLLHQWGKSATADGVKRSGATIYVSRGSGHTGVVTLAVQRHLPL